MPPFSPLESEEALPGVSSDSFCHGNRNIAYKNARKDEKQLHKSFEKPKRIGIHTDLEFHRKKYFFSPETH